MAKISLTAAASFRTDDQQQPGQVQRVDYAGLAAKRDQA